MFLAVMQVADIGAGTETNASANWYENDVVSLLIIHAEPGNYVQAAIDAEKTAV